jgi:uncharacterized membrane protein YbhN (UPF0104 family)
MKTQLTPTHRQMVLQGSGSLLSIALKVYLLSKQGWDEIFAALKRTSSWMIATIILLMVICRLAVASRWSLLLRAVAPRISLRGAFG